MFVVVCDDARTAVSYFNELKRLAKEKVTIKVVRNSRHDASALKIVDLAKKELKALGGKGKHDEADYTSVWALIDMEATSERQADAHNAKKKGEDAGINIALSNPCYEVWTLLHLIDTGEAFINCDAVIDRVAREWKRQFGQAFGRKSHADYSKIVMERTAAVERARKHHQRDDRSWTEVYLVVEEINAQLDTPPPLESGA